MLAAYLCGGARAPQPYARWGLLPISRFAHADYSGGMVARLSISYDVLESASKDLATIKRTLESADRTSEALAGMIPHDRLASVVVDFASQWDRRREELVTQLEGVSAAANGIVVAFGQTDDELAKVGEQA